MLNLNFNFINQVKYDDEIKEVGVDDWRNAFEKQLRLRDKIHDNISLLSDVIGDRELLNETDISKANK